MDNHRARSTKANGMARILIVEDETPLRRILTLNLVRRGHSVAEAESVATAEEAMLASGIAFDLLLLDINLPDGSGWDLLRHLAHSAQEQHLVVIVVTAVRPVQSRMDEFKPAAVLLKPFPIAALLQLVERELARAVGATPVELTEGGENSDLSPTGS